MLFPPFASGGFDTVHRAIRAFHSFANSSPRHSQKRIFDASRCFAALFAHEAALPSSIPMGSSSCKHEICPQERSSEL
jgi:hypothetical protein